jgi:YidC/Oxa1 family membrane protein insertase
MLSMLIAAPVVGIAIFDSLVDGLGSLLAFFYKVIPSYGVSIILLTVAVRLLLFPLMAKQVRSMKRMGQMAPEIKKLQARYRDDRQKLNEETLKFYKENQINPAAGCLPILLQMPIFFALFKVLREPAQHIPQTSELFAKICVKSDGVLATVAECKKGPFPNPAKFLSMDMFVSASDGPDGGFDGFTQALPYFVLIALVILTGLYQGRMMQSQQKDAPPNPQVQMISKILPLFMGFISFGMPAGIVLYFLIGNIWQIGQQKLVFGRDVAMPEIKVRPDDDEPATSRESAASTKKTAVAEEDPTPTGDVKPTLPWKRTPKAAQTPPSLEKPAAPAARATPKKPDLGKSSKTSKPGAGPTGAPRKPGGGQSAGSGRVTPKGGTSRNRKRP